MFIASEQSTLHGVNDVWFTVIYHGETMSEKQFKSPLVSCVTCRKQYSSKGIYTHHERSHGSIEQQEKYSDGRNGCYDSDEYRDKIRKTMGFVRKTITKDCEWCHNQFTVSMLEGQLEKRCCSRSCSTALSNKERIENGYIQPIWSEDRRKLQSDSTKKLWENPDYAKSVLSNNKYFTSKNEVLIREHFINNFSEDGWTFGGSIKIGDSRITRDLYSKKLKICFEYDGIWHFKDIHDQLEGKQAKDRLLEQWCIENQYSLIRLDEDKFMDGSLKMLEEIFYSLKEPTILKIGDRYGLSA